MNECMCSCSIGMHEHVRPDAIASQEALYGSLCTPIERE